MFRRRSSVGNRGPGLASTVARTAVIAGTATATSNAVHNRQQQRQQATGQQAAEQQNLANLQQQVTDLQAQQVQAQVASPAADPAAATDLVTQLERLGQLQQADLLTQDEFNAAKTKLLGL